MLSQLNYFISVFYLFICINILVLKCVLENTNYIRKAMVVHNTEFKNADSKLKSK